MTRKKVNRARKLWNKNRRILRGWQPMRWFELTHWGNWSTRDNPQPYTTEDMRYTISKLIIQFR